MNPARLALLVGVAVAAMATLGRAADSAEFKPPAPPWRTELSQDHPLVGSIYLPDQQRTVSVEELLAALNAAPLVLLGERHDNADHHALQAWLVGRLIAGGRRPAVAFEMFGTEQAAAIARHLARKPKDAAGLAKATAWDQTGWPDWELYRPIAQAALDAGLPVVAANLPDGEAKAMSRRQPVAPERIAELGLDQPMSARLYDALTRDIRDSHCNMLPETAVSPMAMTQRAKDGSMAAVMVKAAGARGTDGAVLIAGAGHVRRDRGVPLAIGFVAPTMKTFSLAFVEVADDITEPAAYARLYGDGALPFDAVWFTPRVGGVDPCAALAERFRHGKPQNAPADKDQGRR